MPTVLHRLFKSPEVKKVLSAYRDEVRKIRNGDAVGLSSPAVGIEMLDDQIVGSIYSGETALKKRMAEGKSPRILALLLISNLANRHITSGHYHVYRGLLSMRGTNLRSLWDYTMNELEKAGEVSNEG